MSCTPNDLGLVLFSRSFCLAESKSTVPPHALRYTDFLDRLLKPFLTQKCNKLFPDKIPHEAEERDKDEDKVKDNRGRKYLVKMNDPEYGLD